MRLPMRRAAFARLSRLKCMGVLPPLPHQRHPRVLRAFGRAAGGGFG